MPKEIKIREITKDIKSLEKAAIVGQHMRTVLVRSKEELPLNDKEEAEDSGAGHYAEDRPY